VDDLTLSYKPVIEEICELDWAELDQAQLTAVAWAYYYFSIQFRESLEIAFMLYPHDPQLKYLVSEECDTDNLSPWPDVAAPDEKLNHDEFMKRVLTLSPIDDGVRTSIKIAGQHYLSRTRQAADHIRAMSIASYEDGGLESVFKAILQAKRWDTPLLMGFRHFLEKHIYFDSDPCQGHGALVRHLLPDDRIRCQWVEFRDLLVTSVPRLATGY
jgi:hypothetical protein